MVATKCKMLEINQIIVFMEQLFLGVSYLFPTNNNFTLSKLVLLLTKLPQNGIILVEVKNELITVKKKDVISLIKYYVEKMMLDFEMRPMR